MRKRRGPWRLSEARRRAGIDDATRRLLLGFVVPTWIGAGLGDWACHRERYRAHRWQPGISDPRRDDDRSRDTSLLGLFFEVNAGVLAITLATLGLHEATAIWDVAYADGRREVTPTEQHIHGLLEQMPVMATAFLFVLHWDQALALFGRSAEPPRFGFEAKRRPLSRPYLVVLFAALAALIAVPYGNELWRCQQAANNDQSPDLALPD